MNNYFKNISSPKEFILDYEINNNEIIVNIIKNKKRIKRKIKLTKQNIQECESKLEKQYKDVISKQELIVDKQKDRKNDKYMVISIIICILSAIAAEFIEPLGMFLCAASILTLIINQIDIKIYNHNLYKRFKVYSDFLKIKTNLETVYQKKPEIIQTIDKKTKQLIEKNVELKEQKLIDNVFDIDFMDKATLKSLKEIIVNYYKVEHQNNQSKTKKLTNR